MSETLRQWEITMKTDTEETKWHTGPAAAKANNQCLIEYPTQPLMFFSITNSKKHWPIHDSNTHNHKKYE